MKKNNAITLIALIITIIVILILAGVTVATLTGENGLLEKASLAGERNKEAEQDERDKLSSYEDELNNYGTWERTGENTEQQVFTKIEETTQVQEFDYVTNKTDGQVFTVPEDGYYKIECWGAQGGSYNKVTGGKGAYTKGIIKLSKDENIYVYVGECYNGWKETMSYNGGGSGSYCTGENGGNTNGGGATDIRIQDKNYNWDDFNSLKSRIMVAAGGAGGYVLVGSHAANGGEGGALIGRNGKIYSWKSYTITILVGATQIQGGIGAQNLNTETYIGKFGKGGYGNYKGSYIYYSGGGGGYYGGGVGAAGDGAISSGSGGSSYISGYEGCNSIAENSTENNIIHTGNVIHYSGRYFLYSQMEPGDSYMPLSSNTASQELGHSGGGHVRITKMNME